ncbi:hypothetical protein VI817_003597 [Penicillium citrinum]|nr:hypothetical protein VI817_003597 [Penicillium citrinum]
MIEEIFTTLSSYPILVCKQCQVAVRPTQITTHLRFAPHKYNIPFCITQTIQKHILARWPEIGDKSDYSEITNCTNSPIESLEDLPVFNDGIRCCRGSDCRYVCRTIKDIKEHWRICHHWLASQATDQSTQSELDQYTQTVVCQYLFSRGLYSNYFIVQSAIPIQTLQPEISSVDTLLEQLETKHQRVFRPSTYTVEATETQYLADRPSETLLSLIQIPDPDPEDPYGYLIRTEIVQTEADTLPKTPLQAYMDLESITKYIHPWQQIVCFFACTQQTSNADCPYYCFNRHSYSPLLSKIIKIARFFVLGCALWLDPYTEQIIQDFLGRYPSDDQDLAMSYNTTEPGYIDWIGQDRLLYKNLSFTIGDLCDWVHSLTTTLETLLSSELLLLDPTTSAPSIPWSILVDNPAESSPGWNFLQDSRTWLVNHIQQKPSLQQRFLDLYCTEFCTNAIQYYLDHICRFQEKLGVLIHLCTGQPGRAPELLSIQHRNTENAYRNIFIEDGLVVLAIQYHKGFYISNDIKIIYQYLPRTIGSLFIQYLWLVLPLPDCISLGPGSFKSANIDLGTFPEDPSRNIAITISCRFLYIDSSLNQKTNQKDYSDNLSDNDSETSHLDLQAGHSAHVAGIVYRR